MDNITTSRSISVEDLREEGNLIIHRWFNTADSMEGNNDSETQPPGKTGEESEVPDTMAIFGNSECNGIVHKANSIPPKAYV